MVQKPEIIAHRGASRACLENTMAAFGLALDQGADGIELDIHGALDGAFVVHHDADVVFEGTLTPIHSLSSAELRTIALQGGHSLPFLEEVFAFVASRATVFVEVKAANLEAPLIALLEHFPEVRSAVHSFDHAIPRRVRELRVATPIGFLFDAYPEDLSATITHHGNSTLWMASHLIDAGLVQAAHTQNARVVAWTENDPARARLLASWGVDGICTDVPALMRTIWP